MKVIENKLFFNQPTLINQTICIIMWVIWFLFLQVNDTDLHLKLKNEYRKHEQELMIENFTMNQKQSQSHQEMRR